MDGSLLGVDIFGKEKKKKKEKRSHGYGKKGVFSGYWWRDSSCHGYCG
jgi:hypothetical protein